MAQEKLIAAVLNFLVWGLGFIYLKDYRKGLFWLVPYIFVGIGHYLIGYGFLFTVTPGILYLAGCLLISANLAKEAYFA